MNIAHVLSHASERFGGVPISTHHLAISQASIGANPSLWSAGTRQDRQEIVETGIPAHIFEITSLSSWRRCPDLTAALNAASSQLDLFHLHDLWAYPQYIAARTARKKNIPYILSPHASLAPWRLRDKRLKKAAYLYACGNTVIRNATALHAVAANEIPDFRKAGYSGPVFVTHNGIDPDMFRHMPAKEEGDVLWPAVKGKRVVLFLSRFSIEKGLDLLIPAWADIAGRPSYADVLLVLAGRDYRSYGLELPRTDPAIEPARSRFLYRNGSGLRQNDAAGARRHFRSSFVQRGVQHFAPGKPCSRHPLPDHAWLQFSGGSGLRRRNLRRPKPRFGSGGAA